MNKLAWIRKLPDWFKTALLFGATLVGIIVGMVELIQFYRDDFELVVAISSLVVFLLVWYLCFHLYLTHSEGRLRRFSLIGIFVVPVLFVALVLMSPGTDAVITYALGETQEPEPSLIAGGKKRGGYTVASGESVTVTQVEIVENGQSTGSLPSTFVPAADNEILILIATFHLTAGTDDRDVHNEIRRAIQAMIDELGDHNLRVEVDPTRLPAEAQNQAKTLGEQYNAAMVIWGADTGVRITVNYLNMKEPGLVSISETERSQLANPSAYASFVTKDLPAQLTFLSLFAVGQSYYSEERYDEAAKVIERAVAPVTPDMDPPEGIANAYFRLGWLYQNPLNDIESALEAYNQAIVFDETKAVYYYNRGTALLKDGAYDQAIEDYDRAVALDPTYAYAYYNRGNAHLKSNQAERAIVDYEQAIELNPRYAKAFNNLCWVGSLSGRAEEVLAACEQAVDLVDETQKASFRDSRGVARALTGDYQGAIDDFRAYIVWLKAEGHYEPGGNGREAWITMLEANENPFDAETLKALLGSE